MAKPLKIVLWIAGAIVMLLVTLALAVSLVFDPNDYRDTLAKAIEDGSGRDVTLGELHLKLFPWLRVSVADAQLGNAAGFGPEPFAKVDEASIGVRVLPLLFGKRIEVSTLKLTGLHLNLAKNKDGVDNWSDIGKARDDRPKVEVEGKAEFDPANIRIGGIDIKDSALTYADAQSGKRYEVSKLELSTGAIRAGKDVDVSLKGHLLSTAPAADADLELKGSMRLEEKKLGVEDLEVTLKGKALEYDADARLTAKLSADLAAKLFRAEAVDLKGTLAGGTLPGGKQDLSLTGNLTLDRAKGTLVLDRGQLKASGLTVDTSIKGENLNGAEPRLSGPVTVGSFNPREWLTAMGRKLDTADAEALRQASLTAQYSGSFKSARLDDLVLKLDQTTAQGRLDIRDFGTRTVDFALKVDQLDADRYLPPKAKTAGGKDGGGGKTSVNDIKLPTETLAKLNANGTVDIGTLKYNGVKMSDVRLKLSGAGDAARHQDVSARLYGGTFSTSNRISPGKQPQFALKTRLTALDAAPFLKDFLDKDYLSGLGNLTLDVTGRGDTVGEARRALNGDVSFRFENGVVKGFNLGKILRQAQAALAGNLNYKEDAPQQTDFTAITASAKIVNGVLKSDSLAGASPLFRLGGAGEVDLVNETINYLARVTIVETSTGQGGKSLEGLKGLTIPIRLTGSLFDPKRKFELDEVLKDQAEGRLHQEYEKQEDRAKEKIREKLGEFLFGKPKEQPAPAPAPPAPPPTP